MYRLGENAKLYASTTTVTSTASFAGIVSGGGTVDNIKDVKVGAKHDTPDYTTRAAGGQKQYASSLTDSGVTFQIKVPAAGVSDPQYTLLRNAWKSKTEIAALALTDTSSVSGSEGPGGNFIVATFDIDEGNGVVLFANVELKPSSVNDWYVAP